MAANNPINTPHLMAPLSLGLDHLVADRLVMDQAVQMIHYLKWLYLLAKGL